MFYPFYKHNYSTVNTFPQYGETFVFNDGRKVCVLPENFLIVEDSQGSYWHYVGPEKGWVLWKN